MSRLVLFFSLLAAVSGLYAQEGETEVHSSVCMSSRMVWRGVESSGATATGVFQFARDGWRVGADISQPFDRDEPGEGKIYAAYGWKLAKTVKLEVSACPRWLIDARPGATKHSGEAGLSAVWELPSGFSVELAGFYDWRLKANTLAATVNYSQPLKNLGAYLEWSATVGTSSARDLRPDAVGPAIRDSYSYYAASVRLPYRIGARSTLFGGLHVAESDGQSRFWSPVLASGGFHAWIDVGLSFDF